MIVMIYQNVRRQIIRKVCVALFLVCLRVPVAINFFLYFGILLYTLFAITILHIYVFTLLTLNVSTLLRIGMVHSPMFS